MFGHFILHFQVFHFFGPPFSGAAFSVHPVVVQSRLGRWTVGHVTQCRGFESGPFRFRVATRASCLCAMHLKPNSLICLHCHPSLADMLSATAHHLFGTKLKLSYRYPSAIELKS